MCDCMKGFNAVLAEKNGRIVKTLYRRGRVLFAAPTILVEKIEPRGKRPPMALPSYCPFCGEKYPDRGNAPESENYRLRTQNAELLAALADLVNLSRPIGHKSFRTMSEFDDWVTLVAEPKSVLAKARGDAGDE